MGNKFTKHNKVLFINYGGIGDEILFLPTIASFKKCYPNSKISLILEPRSSSIMYLTDLIDETFSVDIKASGFKKYINMLRMIVFTWFQGFDMVISSGKSPLVAVILFLMGIKYRYGYKTSTEIFLTDSVELNENQYAGNMYHDLISPICNIEPENPMLFSDGNYDLPKGLGSDGFIALHPGVSKMSVAKNIFKCPDNEFWVETIKKILNKGEKLVLLGGPDDVDVIEQILKDDEIVNHKKFVNFYMKTKNLRELMNLMARAKAVVCVDSAPLHIAVGLNVKTVVIFGPTNEEKLVPKSDNFKVVKNNSIECRPCLWHERVANCEESKCLKILSDEVIEALN